MKLAVAIPAISTAFLLGDCSTYRGGTGDQYNMITNHAESYPEPAGSPTFRPGLNPEDPRDAHFTTRPQPAEPPQP